MRVLRKSELKGIIGLLGIVLLLFAVYFGLNGKLTEWFGFRLTGQKPLVNRIVFVSDRNGSPDIWVMNPDGSDQKALTNDSYVDSEPVVSPDGYTVAFISKRDTPHTQIYAMDPDGSHIHRLSNMTGVKSALRFSPRGNELMFLCGGSVWVVKVNEDSPEKLLPPHEQSGPTGSNAQTPYTWANYAFDGELMGAVQASEQGQFPLWMKLGAEEPSPIVQKTPQGDVAIAGEMVSAAWTADSRLLAIALNTPSGECNLVAYDVDANDLRLITKAGPIASVQWSPDGSSITAVSMKRYGPNDYSPTGIFVADVQGTKKVYAAKDADHPVWSPDGKSVIFVSGADIMSLDPSSGKIANLTKGKGVNSEPSSTSVAKK